MMTSPRPSTTTAKNVPVHDRWHQGIDKDYRNYTRIGSWLIGGVIGFFLIWSIFAPIKGAAVAQGTVIADGNNSAIQHFEGGIIDQVYVQEGDRVFKGQEIMTLDSTQTQVEFNRAKLQQTSLTVRRARLRAERDLKSQVNLADAVDPNVNFSEFSDIIEREQAEFDVRQERFQADITIIEQRIRAIRQQIRAEQTIEKSVREELALIEKEHKNLQYLFSKQLISESRLLSLRRVRIQLLSQIEQANANYSGLLAQLAELEEQAVQTELTFKEQASVELTTTENQLADVQQAMVAARDTLGRVSIVAPKDGVVFRIPKKTPRAVVGAGEVVAEILPLNEELIVEVQLNLADIDLVSVGQVAELRFSALSNRNPPTAEGRVAFISPDRITPENPQELPYYPVRISIDASTWPEEIDRDLVVPGMSVDTFIVTEARSLMGYILEPILEGASFALREN